MAVHIQNCPQRVQSASHQSVLGDSLCASALETARDSGSWRDWRRHGGACGGACVEGIRHSPGGDPSQGSRSRYRDHEGYEAVEETRATAELMMRREISPTTLLLQFLAFSGVTHTDVARKQDEKVMT